MTAFVFPFQYRAVGNFTLMIVKISPDFAADVLAIGDNPDLDSISVLKGKILINATGTDLDYYDYTTDPPRWSSRTMYDPLTSWHHNDLALMHDGIGTAINGDYFYYSLMNGSYTCQKLDTRIPPRDVFRADGVLIGTRDFRGQLCHIWKAQYAGGILEQWVTVHDHQPRRQINSVQYPVSAGYYAQGILITDFMELREMNDIPEYVFQPPTSCPTPHRIVPD